MARWILAGMILGLVSFGNIASFAEEKLSVQQDESGYVVENKFYRLRFDSHGSIVEIRYKDSGKAMKSIYLHKCSIYESGQKAYELRRASSTLKAVKTNQDEQQLQITAKFNTGVEDPDLRPQAKFGYTFYANKPVVKVNIALRQSVEYLWMLTRFSEFHFSEEAVKSGFTHWAVGEDPVSGLISETGKGAQKGTNWRKPYSWSLLYDKDNAFGIITIRDNGPRSFIYVPQYINGYYGKWSSKTKEFEQYLYIGPSNGSYKCIQNWSKKLIDGKEFDI